MARGSLAGAKAVGEVIFPQVAKLADFTGVQIGNLIVRHFPEQGVLKLHEAIDNSDVGGYVGPSKAMTIPLDKIPAEDLANLGRIFTGIADEEQDYRPQQQKNGRNGKHTNGRKLAR